MARARPLILTLHLSCLAGLACGLAGCDDAGRPSDVPAAGTPVSAGKTAASAAAAGLAAGPRLEFDVVRHDFGRISDVGSADYAFVFRNAGTGILEIQEVKPTCGCTVTSLEKTSFAPGESDTIGLTFTPKGHGRQAKQIKVLSNSVNQPVVTLTISAEIVPLAQAKPDYLRLGVIEYGRPHAAVVTIDSLDPDLVIEGITTSNVNVQAELLPEVPGEPHRVRVTIPGNAPWGPMGGRIKVRVRGRPFPGQEPVRHTAEIPVNAQLYNEVRISENPIRVSRVDPRSIFERPTRVSHADGKPFMIFRAHVDPEYFDGATVRVVPVGGVRPAAEYDVFIAGHTGAYLGPVRGHVVLDTDLPGAESEMRLRYLGVVRAES